MTTVELRERNELADGLISKLLRIKELWDEVPGEDELQCLVDKAGSIAADLDKAATTFNAEDFPHPDNLDDLAKKVAGIASDLNETAEAKVALDQ